MYMYLDKLNSEQKKQLLNLCEQLYKATENCKSSLAETHRKEVAEKIAEFCEEMGKPSPDGSDGFRASDFIKHVTEVHRGEQPSFKRTVFELSETADKQAIRIIAFALIRLCDYRDGSFTYDEEEALMDTFVKYTDFDEDEFEEIADLFEKYDDLLCEISNCYGIKAESRGSRYTFSGFFDEFGNNGNSGSENDFSCEVTDRGKLKITKYSGNDVELCVPDELNGKPVEIIGSRAFSQLFSRHFSSVRGRHSANLKVIVLPKSLDTIEDSAFYNCTSLETVRFPKYHFKIEKDAFASCQNLKELNFEGSIPDIDKDAFRDCEKIEVVTFPGVEIHLGKRIGERQYPNIKVNYDDSVFEFNNLDELDEFLGEGVI